MNKGTIIGIIVVIVIGIGVAMTLSFNEMNGANETEISDNENSQPKQFTVNLSEKIGFQEPP